MPRLRRSEGANFMQRLQRRWHNANGRWQMADGRWQMADGRWQMADGQGRGMRFFAGGVDIRALLFIRVSLPRLLLLIISVVF
jgi:hypothetical protein